MTATKWKELFRSLPHGLSFGEVARRLGIPYQQVRIAIHEHGYKATDGRRFSSRRIIPVEKIDWTQSNADISRKFDVSRERIRVLRKRLGKPFVESRGRRKAI